MSAKDCKNPKKSDQCEGASLCPSPPTCPPVQNITHPLRYYEFTEEEMRVLEECDRESFYGRCVPLSTLFATLTYAAVRGGMLSRNRHFGAVPKMLVALLVGHMLGRWSYRERCAAHLGRSLPEHSYLGCIMRKYKREEDAACAPPARNK